jgi:hypothetical protein
MVKQRVITAMRTDLEPGSTRKTGDRAALRPGPALFYNQDMEKNDDSCLARQFRKAATQKAVMLCRR